MAYRMFTRYIHLGQVLGRHVRKPIPSCCAEFIHKKFPDPGVCWLQILQEKCIAGYNEHQTLFQTSKSAT